MKTRRSFLGRLAAAFTALFSGIHLGRRAPDALRVWREFSEAEEDERVTSAFNRLRAEADEAANRESLEK